MTAQLADAGVEVVRHVAGCTREDPSLFSYRRDRVTGRMAGDRVAVDMSAAGRSGAAAGSWLPICAVLRDRIAAACARRRAATPLS